MGCASSNAAASPKVPAAASAPPRLPGTQIFLTHDWADDELGRSNHARVKHVYLRLKAMGITAWFDEEEMRGDINGKMAEGIDNAKTVGVFVTKRYIDKASGKGDAGANDNCKFEFDYALRQKGVDKIIVLVMEPRCRTTADWDGVVGGKLGGKLFIDLSQDGPAFEDGINRLVKEIRRAASRPPSATSAGPHPSPSTSPPLLVPSRPKAITRQLKSLTVDEVCTLLANLDMGKHVEGFRALPVNGAVLDTVDDEDLQQVGVEARMHRKALLKHVETFQVFGVPPELLVKKIP
eukprot:CAMPEP_0180116170 /NCGR_PEP_ID=MMETSP0986-20121125/218_1 /TAXON_ID=697907 /ORGANISM="non described non described, Strain CCMP2293" /LENGTH=292 /DNA_ID=CAMNT_0022054911 /DNA_START=199 /DNA_END=1077 /DNA_ORIENTATION=-